MDEKLSEQDLKAIKGITDSISKAFDAIFDKTEGISDNLKNDVSSLRSIASSVKSINDAEKMLANATAIRNKLATSGYKIQQKYLKSLTESIDGLTQAIDAAGSLENAIDNTSVPLNKFTQRIKDGLDSIGNLVSEVPIIGKYFTKIFDNDKIFESINTFTNTIYDSFKTAYAQKTQFVDAVKSGFGAAINTLKSGVKTMFANPMMAVLTALAAVMGAALYSFYQASEAASEFRKNTGLLRSQMDGVNTSVRDIVGSTASLGVNIEEAYEVAGLFNNEFENLENLSGNVGSSILALNKNFGVSLETSVKINKMFQNIGDLTQEQAQYLSANVSLLAQQANVSPNKVLQDIAENSEVAYNFYGGSVERLASAAIEAAKLGSNLGKAGEIASKLLDFESSITSELNASAMLGVSLNFSRARYLAATDDVVGAQKEILNQVKSIGNLDELNYYQKQALVEATGMQIPELIRMQNIQKRFGDFDADRLEAYNQLIGMGMDMSKITDADIEKQNQLIKQQNENMSDFQQMKAQLTGIGTQALNILLPFGKLLTGILSVTLLPALKAINWVMSGIYSMFDEIGKTQVFQYISNVLNNSILPAFATLRDYLSENTAIFKVFAITAAGVVAIQNTLLILWKSYVAISKVIERIEKMRAAYARASLILQEKGLIGTLKLAKAKLLEWVFQAASSIAKSPIVGPILAAAAAASAYALGQSFFSKAGDVFSPATGKTQVSTKEGGLFELSPNDDLIAAPNLADKIGGRNNSIDVSELVNEIRMLRKDLTDGKIGVYMDGKKVTSRISEVVSGYGGNSYSIV